MGRVLAERLQAKLGQPFIVENKPGASGNTGTEAIAKADADGYTIGLSIVGPLALNKLIFPSLGYDPAKDLAPITIVATQPNVLVVSNELGVSNFRDLAAVLKRDAAKLNFGSIGYGSLSHLAMAAIAMKNGVALTHVPYPGSPAAVTAVIRNDVQMAVLPAASVATQAKGGLLKMLAVTSAKRSPLLPELPTLRESGIEGVEAGAWVGLIAPSKTPVEIQKRLLQAATESLAEPDTREKFSAQYMEVVASTPDGFRANLAEELARWGPVITANKIRIDN
jgi:tripartite-type tricarboxylate transporter receptor subunit TctC